VLGAFHGGDDDESVAKFVEKIADFDGFLELLVGDGHFGSVGDSQTVKIGVKQNVLLGLTHVELLVVFNFGF